MLLELQTHPSCEMHEKLENWLKHELAMPSQRGDGVQPSVSEHVAEPSKLHADTTPVHRSSPPPEPATPAAPPPLPPLPPPEPADTPPAPVDPPAPTVVAPAVPPEPTVALAGPEASNPARASTSGIAWASNSRREPGGPCGGVGPGPGSSDPEQSHPTKMRQPAKSASERRKVIDASS
jgi:hypothetical protein